MRPIELKAIGELSQTLHLEDAVTVFQSGEESDAIYIINRGTLEVVHESPGHAANTPVSYLSRGDMFGETETLSGVPRKNTIRSCEQVSIQRFKKKDFPELIRRVPAFFLLPEPADRQSDDQDHRPGLRAEQLPGTQRQPGEFRHGHDLPDDPQLGADGRIVRRGRGEGDHRHFFFEEGQTKYGRYYHLTGEEAFWQLFLHEKLSGTFSFSIVEPEDFRVHDDAPIRRNPTDLLITALQYRDEFKEMLEEVPDPTRQLRREKLNLEWTDPEYDRLRPVAEAIWQTCYSSVMSLEELCQRLPYCELKFFKTVLQLLETGHFSPARKTSSRPRWRCDE